jgi:acetyltransferase-like isoleucine patch superfamily enzyme
LLPFWGNHCLADFLIATFGFPAETELTLVLEAGARDAALALSSRWRKPVARVHILDDGFAGLVRLVEAVEADHVVLASTSCVFLVDSTVLRAIILETVDHVVKLSVARTPVEAYISRREHLARLLAGAAERDTGRRRLRESLFDRVLHDAMELIVDVPGEILFQNDLMEYYANNIWVIANCESERFHTALSRLPELADKGAESHIAEKGSIRNSWLASGVEIEGTVEDSILFPNVVVRRNALVSRSVVLNGNRIGAGTEIQSALILPFTAEIPRPTPNIGDNCAIGARTSAAKNTDFPTHIHNGISVVGMNADIPNGFKAEAGTYIAPGVPANVLRRIKILKRGSSVLRDRSTLPGGGNGAGTLP